MHIDSYQFGRIVISGKSCHKDVLILPDRIVSPWTRQKGHLLQLKDLIVHIQPDFHRIVIAGTGKFGVMKIAPEFQQWCDDHRIRFITEKTDEAVRIFNRMSKTDKSLIGAFHLTC